MEGVVINPGRGDTAVGSAFVSIGEPIAFPEMNFALIGSCDSVQVAKMSM